MKLIIAVLALFVKYTVYSLIYEYPDLRFDEARFLAKNLLADLITHKHTIESLSKIFMSQTIWGECDGTEKIRSISEALEKIEQMRVIGMRAGYVKMSTETDEKIAEEREKRLTERQEMADPRYPRLYSQLEGQKLENKIKITDLKGWNFTAQVNLRGALKFGIAHQSESFYIKSIMETAC